MRQLFTGIMMLATSALMAQKYSGIITPFKPETLEDIIFFPFGTEYPIKIGSVDNKGQAQFNLDSIDISHIPEDAKSIFLGMIEYNFFVGCDVDGILNIPKEVKATNCGTPLLWKNNEQTGELILVSDDKLLHWSENKYNNEPEIGSFFQILYVDRDINIDKRCAETHRLGSDVLESENIFKLNLKKGFNLIQFKIDSIHKTDPQVTSSIPTKVQILNPQIETEIKWMVNYY